MLVSAVRHTGTNTRVTSRGSEASKLPGTFYAIFANYPPHELLLQSGALVVILVHTNDADKGRG